MLCKKVTGTWDAFEKLEWDIVLNPTAKTPEAARTIKANADNCKVAPTATTNGANEDYSC